MLPASAVPAMVGLALLVAEVSVVKTGLSGAAVSMVMTIPADAGDTFPAASFDVALIVCAPVVNATAGVRLQIPVADAFTVPKDIRPSRTVIVARGSAVPEMTGFVLFITPVIAAMTGASLTLVTAMATAFVDCKAPSLA